MPMPETDDERREGPDPADVLRFAAALGRLIGKHLAADSDRKGQAMSDYQVRIRDQMTDDDGTTLDLGPLAPTEAWWEKPLPPCPDCGGNLEWWEFGHVPGTRKCLGKPLGAFKDGLPVYDPDGGCGSLFHVQTREGRVVLRRERFH